MRLNGRLIYGAILILLVVVPGVSADHAPPPDDVALARTDGTAWCVGDDLHVNLTTVVTETYRVNASSGPNVPTAGHDFPGSYTWTIAGPGIWTGLRFQYAGGDWLDSGLFFISPTAIACPDGVGRDMVDVSAGVVGAFTQHTELLYAPDANAGSGKVMAAGQTLWVLGVDRSGLYYKVLLSGDTYWVPVRSMGPNFDAVWNGTPLPTTVVN